MKQDSFQYFNIICSFEDVYSKAVIVLAILVWLTLNHQLGLFKRFLEEEKNI